MIKIFQKILIILRVLKTNGKYPDGLYRPNGLYNWNPLTYVLLVGVIIVLCVTVSYKVIKEEIPSIFYGE